VIVLPSPPASTPHAAPPPAAGTASFALLLEPIDAPPPRLAPMVRPTRPPADAVDAGPLVSIEDPDDLELIGPDAATVPTPPLGVTALMLLDLTAPPAPAPTAAPAADALTPAVLAAAPDATALAGALTALGVRAEVVSVDRVTIPNHEDPWAAAPPLRGPDAGLRLPPRPAPPPMTGLRGAPVPADPIRDPGVVFEFPDFFLAPREAAATEVAPDPLPAEVGPTAANGSFADDDCAGADAGPSDGQPDPDTAPAAASASERTATPFGVRTETAAATGTDPARGDRSEAVATAQDAQVVLGDRLTLRLDDQLGRWEVDIVRHDDLLDLVLRGDADVQRIVADATPDLRERLAQDGLTLNRVEFQPNGEARGETGRAVEQTSTKGNAGFGDPRHPNGGGARREEAPAWPVPRTPRSTAATEAANRAPEGLLDRAV